MTQILFKGKTIRTVGTLPKAGMTAPDFKLVNLDLHDCTLADFQRKKKIISIVPSLDTPVCSLSSKKFAESVATHPEISLIIISADLPFAQKRICEHLQKMTPLSTFRSPEFGKNYGVLMIDGPLVGLLSRAVLVLDADNKVLYTEQVPEITHEPDYDRALAAAFS